MTLTKKQFEELLNSHIGVDKMFHGNRSLHRAAKTRPYGTYLRNADREKFNVDYASYLRGELAYLDEPITQCRTRT